MQGKIKTTGQLRAFLSETIERLRAGLVDADTAGKITKMAGQINESFYSETKVAKTHLEMGLEVAKLGDLQIGGVDAQVE